MALTEKPADVPEGRAGYVMMTATLFEQIVRDHHDLEITDWGTADRLAVRGVISDIYVPTVIKHTEAKDAVDRK